MDRGRPQLSYRVLFSLAAAYNLAFGFWAGLFPHSFFNLMKLPQPLYPSLWACLGMVVGLYGLVYAWVAWKPEAGDVLIWIGLLGKVLGPLGWMRALELGEFPPLSFFLILFNDLIWWFPFLFYLLRNHPWRPQILTGLVVLVHSLASLGLVWVRGGNEFNPDLAARREWVLGNTTSWVAVWALWVISSTSILAFFALWGRELKNFFSRDFSRFLWIPAIGVLCDLAGEVVNIVWLTDPEKGLSDFLRGTDLYLLLSAAGANGIYCLTGLGMSWASWRSGLQRGGLALLGFTMWTVGVFLTVTALLHYRMGILVTGSGVMTLFIPWAALTARQWRVRAVTEVER